MTPGQAQPQPREEGLPCIPRSGSPFWLSRAATQQGPGTRAGLEDPQSGAGAGTLGRGSSRAGVSTACAGLGFRWSSCSSFSPSWE